MNIAHKKDFLSHPLYYTWSNMIARCYRKSSPNYKRYGGSGVTVCKEWREDKWKFIIWGLNNGWEAGLEIDRINNSLIYGPRTCRFVTKTVNLKAQRLLRSTNTSGFRGVRPAKRFHLYGARVNINGKDIHVGSFKRKIIAAAMRDKFVLEHSIGTPLNLPELFYNAAL